ncbi:hypothetical protein CYMTET_53499 [Cymbomonas tetramitiformis]|uniref:Uncharacterized protein n=1 Tax=Cymbomonas tetramitiformis TaxID=36881 RepID=A0AAE0BGR6_9CHLO|nr:hypothetical protein CYMTET_53499 [Cymbomonas tetramitiformis]
MLPGSVAPSGPLLANMGTDSVSSLTSDVYPEEISLQDHDDSEALIDCYPTSLQTYDSILKYVLVEDFDEPLPELKMEATTLAKTSDMSSGDETQAIQSTQDRERKGVANELRQVQGTLSGFAGVARRLKFGTIRRSRAVKVCLLSTEEVERRQKSRGQHMKKTVRFKLESAKVKAVMNTHAKANVPPFRDRKGGKGKGSASSGAGAEGGGRGDAERAHPAGKVEEQKGNEGVGGVLALSTVRSGPKGGVKAAMWQQGVTLLAEHRQAGGCGLEEHQQGARVLPYMDDCWCWQQDESAQGARAGELYPDSIGVGAQRQEAAMGAHSIGGAPWARGGPEGGVVPRDANMSAEDLPPGEGASQLGVSGMEMASSLEADSVCGALSVGVSSSASGEVVSQGAPLCALNQVGLGGEGEADTSGVERHGVVAQATGSELVVAMLSHFTSRNPERMQRMRRLWILLDLNDIELQVH